MYTPAEGPLLLRLWTLKSSLGGRGFVLWTTGARGAGHTKMRVQMQLTDVRCWDCGNLVTDLDRRGFRSLALGKDNKIKQVIKGIRAGRLDSG